MYDSNLTHCNPISIYDCAFFTRLDGEDCRQEEIMEIYHDMWNFPRPVRNLSEFYGMMRKVAIVRLDEDFCIYEAYALENYAPAVICSSTSLREVLQDLWQHGFLAVSDGSFDSRRMFLGNVPA